VIVKLRCAIRVYSDLDQGQFTRPAVPRKKIGLQNNFNRWLLANLALLSDCRVGLVGGRDFAADYVVTQTFPMMVAKDSWFVAHFNHAAVVLSVVQIPGQNRPAETSKTRRGDNRAGGMKRTARSSPKKTLAMDGIMRTAAGGE
jgi:hypothetical protein